MTGEVAPLPASVPPPPSGYPVRIEVVRPERQSRLTNAPVLGSLIRAVLAIPHFIILYFLGLAAGVLYFIATFAILFTGKYPAGMYNFYVSYARWSGCVSGYTSHLYDTYPKFSFEAVRGYPLAFEASPPPRSSRLLNFPLFGGVLKLILLIPHYIVVTGLGMISLLVLSIAQFVILFTGGFPGGMHAYVFGVSRWGMRMQAYLYGITDKYPPFSLQ